MRLRTLILMYSLVGVMMALAAGCALLDPNPGPDPISAPAGQTPSPDPPADSTAATLERGLTLYQQNCARCHGDSAEGTLIWPTPIQGRSGISDLIHNGRRSMPAFATLSDSAIASIELFLNSFKVSYEGVGGAELFKTYCSSCHGDSARGATNFPGSIQGYEPIHDIVVKGKGEMLAVNLPDSVIAKIQEYLKGFNVDLTNVSGAEYYSRECAKCHGAAGEGTTRGYEIRNPVAGYATYVVRNGRPGVPYFKEAMPSYPKGSLSEAQLTEIITMLRSAAKPADGAGLYNRFCANCHGKDANGGPVGKGIRKETGEFREKIREGEGGSNYGRRTDYMPSWSQAEITDNEINLMISYVRSLR